MRERETDTERKRDRKLYRETKREKELSSYIHQTSTLFDLSPIDKIKKNYCASPQFLAQRFRCGVIFSLQFFKKSRLRCGARGFLMERYLLGWAREWITGRRGA